MVNDLGLEQSDDRLSESIVVRVADAADRRLDAGLLQALSVTNREILASPVAMMNHAFRIGTSPQRLLKRIQDQIRMHRAGDTPADDAARKHIDDESHVYESRPGRDVCEIGDPELIRPNGSEQALDQISRIFRLVASDSGSAFATAHNPLQPERSHQSFDGTAGDGDAIPSELPPNLAGAVDLEVIIVHAPDFTRNLGIASKARRFSLRLSLSRFLFVVDRGGDRQLLADRLDTIRGSVLVDKRHHYFGRRSSSAWAKKAAALRRISLARFNSRFSRSSCLRRSSSVLVSQARLPWSRSACRTHWRKDSAVQPILPAIEMIAAHCDSCFAWCSKTIRTARSRTSGEYFGTVFMTPYPLKIWSLRQTRGGSIVTTRLDMIKRIDDRLRNGIFDPEADLRDLDEYLRNSIGRSSQDTIANRERLARMDNQLELWQRELKLKQKTKAWVEGKQKETQDKLDTEDHKLEEQKCASCIASLTQELASYEILLAQLESEIVNLRCQIENRVKQYNMQMQERVKFGEQVQSLNDGWSRFNKSLDELQKALSKVN